MSEVSQAWVWSQYQGVVSDEKATAPSSDRPSQPPREGNVEQFKPRLASAQDMLKEKVAPVRAKYGYVIAGAVLAGLFFPMIAMVLFVIAALLIFSGREPKKAQEFLDSAPGGSYIIRALNSIDNLIK